MPSAITLQEKILDTTPSLISGILTFDAFSHFISHFINAISKIMDFYYQYFANIKLINSINTNKINRRQHK